nr:MAG TPA: hypothetical protein [Caudoviricetes sp.]
MTNKNIASIIFRLFGCSFTSFSWVLPQFSVIFNIFFERIAKKYGSYLISLSYNLHFITPLSNVREFQI